MSDTGDQDFDGLGRADMQRLVAGHDAAMSNLMERHSQRLFHYQPIRKFVCGSLERSEIARVVNWLPHVSSPRL